jgi:hypothetical protein
MAPRKQVAIMDKPSIDPKDVVEKFYGGLKKYKHKISLEDLGVRDMTAKEFLQHGDYTKFEYRKVLVPKHIHLKLS